MKEDKTKRVPLESPQSGRFVRIMQIVFGIVCLFTALWWAIYIIKTPDTTNNYWIATLFIGSFGAFQVYAGLGHAARYIERSGTSLTVKNRLLGKPAQLIPRKIEKVVIRSLTVSIEVSEGKNIFIRFGIANTDLIDQAKSLLISYCEENNIELSTGN